MWGYGENMERTLLRDGNRLILGYYVIQDEDGLTQLIYVTTTGETLDTPINRVTFPDLEVIS